MGHAAQIAMGIARNFSQRKVVCLDGDGAFFMHMGGLTNSAECDNLLHIVLNNGAHDSVGGQPTKGRDLHLTEIARACGYRTVALANVEEEIRSQLGSFLLAPHSCFLEIKCRPGARSDLGRPDRTPWENKSDFMNFLKALNGRQN